MRVAVALIITALWTWPTVAVSQVRVPVAVTHIGADQVGALYVYEIREGIRGSQGMRLVDDNYPDGHIKLVITTVDADSRETGRSSAMATTFLYDSRDIPLAGAFLTQYVHACGRDRVASCARDIVAATDNQIQRLRTRNERLWKTLFQGQ